MIEKVSDCCDPCSMLYVLCFAFYHKDTTKRDAHNVVRHKEILLQIQLFEFRYERAFHTIRLASRSAAVSILVSHF